MIRMIDPTSFIARFGEAATLQTRSLDKANRDAVTGWPPVSYEDSSIEVLVEQMSTRLVDAGGGMINEVRLRAYTVASVSQGDRLVVRGATYVVELPPEPFAVGGTVVYWGLVLLKVS